MLQFLNILAFCMKSTFPLSTLPEFHFRAQSGKSGISRFCVGLPIELKSQDVGVWARSWSAELFVEANSAFLSCSTRLKS
jgi:hypothetical protein